MGTRLRNFLGTRGLVLGSTLAALGIGELVVRHVFPPGFGLRQEFEYLKLEGVLYEPDIVILALCQNDIYRDGQSPQEQFQAMQGARRQRAPSGLLGPLKTWLAERVVLYQLSQQAINTNRSLVKALVALRVKEQLLGFEGLDPSLMPALRTYPPELQSSYVATEADLREIRDWLAGRKIRFILTLIPALQAIDARAFRHSIAYTVFEPSDFELEKPYRDRRSPVRKKSKSSTRIRP